MLKDAIPPAAVPVPMGMPPSLKVTVPVAPAVTVAVKVTELPYVEGSEEADIRTVEASCVPASATVLDWLGKRLASPEYDARTL